MKPVKPHESQRGYFAYYLYYEMEKNPNIWVVTADLGHGMWDSIREDYSDRFLNTGASEMAAMDIAVGLSLEGKIPFVYSITPFILARPYEAIRNYVDRERLPVKIVGSGRDYDYSHDGYSHYAHDAEDILSNLPYALLYLSVKCYWPDFKDDLREIVPEVTQNGLPCFVSLKR